MGQKVHPYLFRLGQSAKWRSRWFDIKHYGKFAVEDYKIRKLVDKQFKKAAVAFVDIERFGSSVTIAIHTARPGVIIGRGGAGVESFKKEVAKLVGAGAITINIQEVRNPEDSAPIIANNIAEQIERRIPFRRVVKQSIETAKQARAKGIKVIVSGRLNGAEIARTEAFSFGTVPLHTIKQPIDYALRVAYTTYGTIGIKVWVSRSEADDETPD
ncbi:MAG: 30S ribosomal protein S3 [bacterium]